MNNLTVVLMLCKKHPPNNDFFLYDFATRVDLIRPIYCLFACRSVVRTSQHDVKAVKAKKWFVGIFLAFDDMDRILTRLLRKRGNSWITALRYKILREHVLDSDNL